MNCTSQICADMANRCVSKFCILKLTDTNRRPVQTAARSWSGLGFRRRLRAHGQVLRIQNWYVIPWLCIKRCSYSAWVHLCFNILIWSNRSGPSQTLGQALYPLISPGFCPDLVILLLILTIDTSKSDARASRQFAISSTVSNTILPLRSRV